MKEKRFYSKLIITLLFFSVTLPAGAQEATKAENIRQEIRVLNLVNGLDLSREQIRKIVESAEAIDRLRAQFQSSVLRWDRDMEQILEEIRSQLNGGGEVDQQTAQTFYKMSNQVKRGRLKLAEAIEAEAREVEDILEPHQLFQMESYIPCIIPPRGELRIGQARDYKGMAKRLEQIRRIPARAYMRRKNEIIQRSLLGMKLNAPRNMDRDEEGIAEQVRILYDKARRLDDTEFEIQKDGLAEGLLNVLKPEHKTGQVQQKIEKFLLSSEILSILRARLDDGG